jgi:hypothetical protein
MPYGISSFLLSSCHFGSAVSPSTPAASVANCRAATHAPFICGSSFTPAREKNGCLLDIPTSQGQGQGKLGTKHMFCPEKWKQVGRGFAPGVPQPLAGSHHSSTGIT